MSEEQQNQEPTEPQAVEPSGALGCSVMDDNAKEITLDDVIAWADGTQSALGTEHCDRVTEKEAHISYVILQAQNAEIEAR